MGECLLFGKGVLDTSYKENFADNSWSKIIKACQNNEVPITWKVGDQKPMTIDGTDYLIDIIGKDHDYEYDHESEYPVSDPRPLTFQFHDTYETPAYMNDVPVSEGWKETYMRNTHLPYLLTLMPTEVQNAIKEIAVYSMNYDESTDYHTADKLFLLDTSQIGFDGYGLNVYEYYNSTERRKKYYPGTTGDGITWWTRTMAGEGMTANLFRYVDGDGYSTSDNGAPVTGNMGVSPAFCF